MTDADRLAVAVAKRFTIRTRAGSESALNSSAVASASASERTSALSGAQQSTASRVKVNSEPSFISMNLNVSKYVDTCQATPPATSSWPGRAPATEGPGQPHPPRAAPPWREHSPRKKTSCRVGRKKPAIQTWHARRRRRPPRSRRRSRAARRSRWPQLQRASRRRMPSAWLREELDQLDDGRYR